jgi:hypothetical protein
VTGHAETGEALLERAWIELAETPRFMGTPGADRALDVIEGFLGEMRIASERKPFQYPGWSQGRPVELSIGGRPFEAYAMLGSPGVRKQVAIEGRLHYVGPFGIWGRHDWQRFALVDGAGKNRAYLLGRRDREPIPQALPEGIDRLPYIGIGGDAVGMLLGTDVGTPDARLRCSPSALGPRQGVNLAVELPPLGDHTVLIGAHYDSLFCTPGAYDNASGAACLLALAGEFQEGIPGVAAQMVWFGAEEWLLGGSSGYCTGLAQDDQLPDFMLNLDGIGRGDRLEVWYGPDRLLQGLRSFIDPIATDQGFHVEYLFPPPAGSDHAPFYRRGCPVCMLTFNDLDILHRPEDVPDEAKFGNMLRVLAVMRSLFGSAEWLVECGYEGALKERKTS